MTVKLRLDAASSTIAVRTFAEGLFARLAHDLEITASGVSGEGTDGPDAATLRAPVSGLRVAGVVRDGVLNDRTLSAADRADIERRMREALGDELRAGDGAEIQVAATLAGDRAAVEVRTPRGVQAVSVPVRVERGQIIRVRGECELSLRALGVPPVRGPAGAFRLADRVQIRFDVSFGPA